MNRLRAFGASASQARLRRFAASARQARLRGFAGSAVLRVTMVAALMLAWPGRALACPVCFGAADSPVTNAVNLAILALLGVTGTVLGGFVAFFVHLARRARQVREQEWAHDR